MIFENKFPDFRLHFAPGKSIPVQWLYGYKSMCPVIVELSYKQVDALTTEEYVAYCKEVIAFYATYWPTYEPHIPVQMSPDAREEQQHKLQMEIERRLPAIQTAEERTIPLTPWFKKLQEKRENLHRQLDPNNPNYSHLQKQEHWERWQKIALLERTKVSRKE